MFSTAHRHPLLSTLLLSAVALFTVHCSSDDDEGTPNQPSANPPPATEATPSPEAPRAPQSYRVLIRARLKSADASASKTIHDTVGRDQHQLPLAKSEISHAAFLNVKDARDFLAVDTWSNLDEAKTLYGDTALQARWSELFEGPPSVEIWARQQTWTEWGTLTPETLKSPIYLFRIRNRLSADKTEDSRVTHNRVAGGVSQQKAISLGDLAHNVHLSAQDPHELLFLDVWQDPSRAQQFFTDPETIKGGAEVFVGPPDVVVFGLTDWLQW